MLNQELDLAVYKAVAHFSSLGQTGPNSFVSEN